MNIALSRINRKFEIPTLRVVTRRVRISIPSTRDEINSNIKSKEFFRKLLCRSVLVIMIFIFKFKSETKDKK